jgi:hypothetical protein
MKAFSLRFANRWLQAVPFSMLIVGACAGDPEAANLDHPVPPAEELSSNQQELARSMSAAVWPNGRMPVCWRSAVTFPGVTPTVTQACKGDLDSCRRRVRRRAIATWSAAANVNFVGWNNTCPSQNSADFPGTQYLDLVASDGGGASSLGGPQGPNSQCLGQAGLGPCGTGFDVVPPNFEDSQIPHEFGHALGFIHEMQREGFVDLPNTRCVGENVPTSSFDGWATPPDKDSVMAGTYCNNNLALSGWDEFAVQQVHGKRVDGVAILASAWSSARTDHATVATPEGIASVRSAGYEMAYLDGWLFTMQAPGTVPLKLFWHPQRNDNVISATAATEQAVLAAGYQFVRIEGYVYQTPQPGPLPNGLSTRSLITFWSPSRHDHFTTASPEGQSAARANGYVEVRVEGHVFAQRPYDLLWQYRLGDDYLTGAQESQTVVAADDSKYNYIGFDGAVLRFPVAGTTPLRAWWSAARQDNALSASAASKRRIPAPAHRRPRVHGTHAKNSRVAVVVERRSNRSPDRNATQHRFLCNRQLLGSRTARFCS